MEACHRAAGTCLVNGCAAKPRRRHNASNPPAIRRPADNPPSGEEQAEQFAPDGALRIYVFERAASPVFPGGRGPQARIQSRPRLEMSFLQRMSASAHPQFNAARLSRRMNAVAHTQRFANVQKEGPGTGTEVLSSGGLRAEGIRLPQQRRPRI